MNIVLLIILVVLSAAGLLGIIVPGLPDTILIFVGVLIYAIFTHFQDITLATILILAGLTILTNLLDWLGAAYGAKKFGATKFGIIGAIVGGILGFIFLSFLGLLIGGFLGTIIAEVYWGKKEYQQAFRAGTGTLIGVIGSSFIKIIIALVMIILIARALI